MGTLNAPCPMATRRHAAMGLLRERGLANIQRALRRLGRHPHQVADLRLGLATVPRPPRTRDGTVVVPH